MEKGNNIPKQYEVIMIKSPQNFCQADGRCKLQQVETSVKKYQEE